MISANDEWKIETDKYKCPFCQCIKSKNGIGRHIWKSHTDAGKNLDVKIKKTYVKGRKATNQFIKGTKKFHSDETKQKIAKSHFGIKPSDETKKKLSDSQLKFLTEHPDRVPYIINHSSKESYPEKIFRDALIKNNISGWKYKYRAGIYEYDFAFPELKLDIEIDGETHKTEKVIRIDKRRDEYTRSNGWSILRFDSKTVKSNIASCINKVKGLLA